MGEADRPDWELRRIIDVYWVDWLIECFLLHDFSGWSTVDMGGELGLAGRQVPVRTGRAHHNFPLDWCGLKNTYWTVRKPSVGQNMPTLRELPEREACFWMAQTGDGTFRFAWIVFKWRAFIVRRENQNFRGVLLTRAAPGRARK